MSFPSHLLYAAKDVGHMSKQVGDQTAAKVMMGMSVGLIALMVFREITGLLRDVNRHCEQKHGHAR
jgi:hypothetical protein